MNTSSLTNRIQRQVSRRVSTRVASFTVTDMNDNTFNFARKLTTTQVLRPFCFLREFRMMCRAVTRNGLREAYVQIPGRDPIELT